MPVELHTGHPDVMAVAMAQDETSPPGPRQRRRLRANRRTAQPEPVVSPPQAETQDPVAEPEAISTATRLHEPRGGVPELVVDEVGLGAAAARLATGSGPVAIDAERASGYRYGQRAYLIQLNRRGIEGVLIDPMACTDLTVLAEAIADDEWVIHAATQDLPCLAEIGLRPRHLFDTELGARLAGQPRVGLGAVVEHYLGLSLAKEHSAADWSTRPLPEPWLRYAALDVEVLVELRDAIAADLLAQGKAGWAQEEFDALLSFTGPAPRVDPWRRTSGMHRIRKPRELAAVRELWLARDELAAERDVSPGRVLPDAAIVAMAGAPQLTAAIINDTRELRAARRHTDVWLSAVARARALPASELPPATLPSGAPPPVRAWAERDAPAAKRLAQVRAGLAALSEEHTVPAENLISPDLVRRILWTPPKPSDDVRVVLAAGGARAWQIGLVAPLIDAALTEHPAAGS